MAFVEMSKLIRRRRCWLEWRCCSARLSIVCVVVSLSAPLSIKNFSHLIVWCLYYSGFSLARLCPRNFYTGDEMATAEKPVMVVGIDDSEHSIYGLEWALDHFFAPYAPNFPFNLVIVHAKPSPTSAIGLAGPGAADILPFVEADLKKIAARLIEKAKEICLSKSVHGVILEALEGDARNVLCDAVDKHHATMLVVGSHGYGAIKRAVLGSVSDYCAHHAHCSVMIVKQPKTKH